MIFSELEDVVKKMKIKDLDTDYIGYQVKDDCFYGMYEIKENDSDETVFPLIIRIDLHTLKLEWDFPLASVFHWNIRPEDFIH